MSFVKSSRQLNIFLNLRDWQKFSGKSWKHVSLDLVPPVADFSDSTRWFESLELVVKGFLWIFAYVRKYSLVLYFHANFSYFLMSVILFVA